jgi:hypothetical protein
MDDTAGLVLWILESKLWDGLACRGKWCQNFGRMVPSTPLRTQLRVCGWSTCQGSISVARLPQAVAGQRPELYTVPGNNTASRYADFLTGVISIELS